MRYAVQQDRVEAGVAQHDFYDAAGGGVTAEDGFYLFANSEHPGSIML